MLYCYLVSLLLVASMWTVLCGYGMSHNVQSLVGTWKAGKMRHTPLTPTLAARVRTQYRGLSFHTLLHFTHNWLRNVLHRQVERTIALRSTSNSLFLEATEPHAGKSMYSGRDNRTSQATSKTIWVESWLCCSFWFFSDFWLCFCSLPDSLESYSICIKYMT